MRVLDELHETNESLREKSCRIREDNAAFHEAYARLCKEKSDLHQALAQKVVGCSCCQEHRNSRHTSTVQDRRDVAASELSRVQKQGSITGRRSATRWNMHTMAPLGDINA